MMTKSLMVWLLLASSVLAQNRTPDGKHFTGRKPLPPAALKRLADEAHNRHGNLIQRLPRALAPAYDSRQFGCIPPIRDQGQCGSCFPEGTMIRMADGSERRIEDIRENDCVLTAEGNIGRVMATMRRSVNEHLLRLDTWGHSNLEATSEHPILTKRGYVKLCEIQEGDWVAFPKYAPNMVSWIHVDGFVRETRQEKQPLPDDIRLTAEFGRLSGLFLAEGSTDRARVVWSFNATEASTLAAETVALVRSELGMDADIAITDKGTCAKVIVFSTRLAELFRNLFGTGAANKQLHPVLTGGTDEFLRGVLGGWMDGDKHRNQSAVSISQVLALQMFDIANANSLMPAMQTHTKAKTDKLGIFHQHAWRVNLNDPVTYKRGSASQDQIHMWRKVRQVARGKFHSGPVYNLEVEGDHSYVSEGVGVHNCWDFSGTGCVTIALVKAGQIPNSSNQASEQYTLDCGQNGGCSGDDNTTVLTWAKSTGLPLDSDYGSYSASSRRCSYTSSMKLYKITDWGFCTSGGNGVASTADIKAAIVAYGCVGCAVDAGFSDPGTGVISGGGNNIDHDVILVGWDDSKGRGGAWIMRNSWGTGWGNGGYAWIEYGSYSIGTEAVWCVAQQSKPPNPWVFSAASTLMNTPAQCCISPAAKADGPLTATFHIGETAQAQKYQAPRWTGIDLWAVPDQPVPAGTYKVVMTPEGQQSKTYDTQTWWWDQNGDFVWRYVDHAGRWEWKTGDQWRGIPPQSYVPSAGFRMAGRSC